MSRIDSSVPLTVRSVGGDDGIHPGDTLRLRGGTTATESAEVWVMPAAPDPSTRPSRPEKAGEARRIGSLPGMVTWTAGDPGTYQLATGPNPRLGLADYRRDDMDVDTGIIRYDVTAGEGTSVDADDYLNTTEPDNGLADLADKPGFVAADNEHGVRVAPALRDEIDTTIDDLVSSSSSEVDSFADRVDSAASTSTSSSSTSTTSSFGIGQVPGILVVAAAVVAGWWWLR